MKSYVVRWKSTRSSGLLFDLLFDSEDGMHGVIFQNVKL
jgi:hypothetical protein